MPDALDVVARLRLRDPRPVLRQIRPPLLAAVEMTKALRVRAAAVRLTAAVVAAVEVVDAAREVAVDDGLLVCCVHRGILEAVRVVVQTGLMIQVSANSTEKRR